MDEFGDFGEENQMQPEAPVATEPKRRVKARPDKSAPAAGDDDAYNPGATGGGGGGGGGDKTRRVLTSDAAGGGNPLLLSYLVRDKLQLLDYTHSFCKNYGLKPISPLFFAMAQSNGYEQLNYLKNLVHWLCEECGHVYIRPENYDEDPNAVAATILQELKRLGKFPVDVPLVKIKSANGEGVLYILNALLDAALDTVHFHFEKAVQPSEQNAALDHPDEIEDEAAENALLEHAETHADPDDDALEESYAGELAGSATNVAPKGTPNTMEEKDFKKKREVIESKVNPAAWKLELERVAPQLKVTVTSDIREWRSRLEQISTFLNLSSTQFPEHKTNLTKIAGEVRQNMEKVSSRERSFQSQLESLIMDYRQVSERFQEINENYKGQVNNMQSLTQELSNVTDDLEMIKNKMQDKGESMTDSSPLLSIKSAIANIKNEILAFDVRIAVLQQSLLQTKMKEHEKARQSSASRNRQPLKV